MKTFFCLAVALLILSLRASATEPTWTELESLIGIPLQGESMQKFARDHALKKVSSGDSGSYKPDTQSYSIHFEKDVIDCVILHVGPPPKNYAEAHWLGYEGDLPFGLKRLFVRKDVIGLLGEPDVSAGNFWPVRDFELRISFSASTGLIQEVYIWKKIKASAKKPA